MQDKKGPSGLLVGLIIGGALGALLSTKKGRKILKDVADYGLEYVGNSIDMEDIETILNDQEEDMPPFTQASEGRIDTDVADNSSGEKEPSRRKRLFRGIRKK